MKESEQIDVSSTDKTGEEQLLFLGLRPEQLHGRILDLGSGRTEKLKDTIGLPDDCEIISLSKHIFLGVRPFIHALIRKLGWDKKTVEGNVLALPFEDESFDRVISVDSIPHFLGVGSQVRRAFQEVVRVLKPGGEARFIPAIQVDYEEAIFLPGPIEEVLLEPIEERVIKKYSFITDVTRRLIIRKKS